MAIALRVARWVFIEHCFVRRIGREFLWLYISAYIALLEAEINSEIEHQTASYSTTGSERPSGRRLHIMRIQ